MNHWEGKTIPTDYQPERTHSQKFQDFRDCNKRDLHCICSQSGVPHFLWLNPLWAALSLPSQSWGCICAHKARHPQALSPVSFVT